MAKGWEILPETSDFMIDIQDQFISTKNYKS